MQPIYFDNNASTPVASEVLDAINSVYQNFPGNPSSQHAAGRAARQRLRQAHDAIVRLLGADLARKSADQVIFTSGGTEANNLALRGLVGPSPGRIVISAIEHPSVNRVAEDLANQGWKIDLLEVNHEGLVQTDRLESLLTDETQLVSVMLANNESGVIQPVPQIAQVCQQRGIPLHTDACQAIGKIEVNFHALGVTALTCAAHKFHGPRGVGTLVIRSEIGLKSLLFGGFQQQGTRPGTEPVALAVGMQAALESWNPQERTMLQTIRDRFEDRLTQTVPNLVIHGKQAPRLPNTSLVSFLGLDRQALAMACDLAGVACSTGSACASGSSDPSPTLLAMGCPEAEIDSALRFSFGRQNTASEVDLAVDRISKICKDLRPA